MGIRMNGKKANHQTIISCQLLHQGVTKDEVKSVSADGAAETSRSSASSDRMRQTASGNRMRRMLEWFEDFTEGLVDRDSNQKHLFPSLHLPTENGRTRNLFMRFPKDPFCEICRSTTITRALC